MKICPQSVEIYLKLGITNKKHGVLKSESGKKIQLSPQARLKTMSRRLCLPLSDLSTSLNNPMIQEILKEFKKEFVSETFLEGTPVVAFYNEEDRTLDLWQWYKVEAFFEKSLKRVEEEAFKRGCEMGARSSFKIVEDLTT